MFERGSEWVSTTALCSTLVQENCPDYKYFIYGRQDGERCDASTGGCKCWCETESLETCTKTTLSTYDLYEVRSKTITFINFRFENFVYSFFFKSNQ